jgi:hypothetical protein
MKKFLVTIFIVVVAIQCWAYSFSAVAPSGQTLYYNITSAMIPGMPQTVAVTYPGTSSSDPYSGYTQPLGNLTIPSTVSYNGTTYTVTEIGDYAFLSCTNLMGSLTLPNTITRIGHYAFNGCSGLTGTLTLPEGITIIGTYAFQNCHFTGALILPSTLTEVSNWSFAGCTGFTSVTFPNNINRIGNHAFDNCDGLTGALNIPDAVTSIGWRAFYDCDHITSVNTGNGVQTIYYGAFCHCDALTSLIIGDQVRRIYDFAFYGCSSLTTVTMGVSIDSIDYSVFGNCTSLAAITMRQTTPPIIVTASTNYRPDATRGLSLDQGAPHDGIYCEEWLNGSRYHVTMYYNYHKYDHGHIPWPLSCSWFQSSISNYQYLYPEEASMQGGSSYPWSYYCHSSQYIIPSGTSPYLTSFQDLNISAIYLHVPCNAVLAYQVSPYWGNSFNLQGFMTYSIQTNSSDNNMGTTALTQWPTCNNPNAIITATANNEYHFKQWNDGNTDNPRMVGITQDTSFTAIFASNWVNITATSNNSEYGSATGSGTYYYNTAVTLQATPAAYYHFVSWSDGSTDNPRTITAENDLTLTAIFAIDQHTLVTSVNNNARGTVTGGGTYNYGTSVFITASPNTGYYFAQWNDGNTSNPRNIVVTHDTSFTAHFGVYNYTIVVAANDPAKGTVTGGGTYEYGTQIVLTATPNTGFRFVQWGDGNTDAPRIVTVTDNAAYTAIFAPLQHTITVLNSTPSMGQVTGGGVYNLGDSATLTAIPYMGYHFVQWNDGVTVSPRTIQVTNDAVYTALFAPNSYTLNVNSSNSEQGTVTGGGIYDYYTTVTLSATANYGYHFVQWSDGNTNNPRSITITNDASYTAQFAPNSYTLTVSSIDTAKGLVTGSGSYEYNTTAILTATALNGYHFTQWNDGNEQSSRTVVVTQDASYQAFFMANTYSVNATAADSTQGTVVGGGVYEHGSQIVLQAVPAQHHHFVQWDDGNTSNPRVVIVLQDLSFSALFEPDEQYTLTVVSDDPERGSVTGGGVFYSGEQTMIIANAFEHFIFDHWSDGSTSNPKTVTIIDNVTYTAYFVGTQHTVNVFSNDDNLGTVAGGGVFEYGSSAMVTANPTPGNSFVRWSNGSEENPYTFTVYGDVNLIANFQQGNGIEDNSKDNWYLFAQEGQIVLRNIPTDEPVQVYDMLGKLLYSAQNSEESEIKISVPTAGVYLVRVGEQSFKKIVVTK